MSPNSFSKFFGQSQGLMHRISLTGLAIGMGLSLGVLSLTALVTAAPPPGWTLLDGTGGLVDFALVASSRVSPTLYAAASDNQLSTGAIFSGTGEFGGPAWTNVFTGTPFIEVAIDPVTPTILYAGSYTDLFWRSQNGGISWTQSINGLNTPLGSVFAIQAASSPTLTVGTDDGVFFSSDGGDTWFASGLSGLNVYSLKYDGDVLVAGTNAGVQRSLDDGLNWTVATTDVVASDVNVLLKAGQVLYAGAGDGSTPGGVFTSTDQADSWSFAGAGITTTLAPTTPLAVRALVASQRAPRVVLAATGEGVYVTGNHGQSWFPSKVVLIGSAKSAWSLASSGTVLETVYAGTEGGVFSQPLFSLGCPALYANVNNAGGSANVVNGADITQIAGQWHTGSTQEDMDDSGRVTVLDIMIAASVMSSTCTP